jgi:hypothetical protein
MHLSEKILNEVRSIHVGSKSVELKKKSLRKSPRKSPTRKKDAVIAKKESSKKPSSVNVLVQKLFQ